MAQITKVSVQKNNKKKVNLYIDDDFFCALTLETAVKHHLKSGIQVDTDKLNEIISQSQTQEAFQKATDYVLKNLKTKRQVKDYLVKKGYSEEVAWQCVDKLKEYGYIDDVEFAKRYIEISSQKQGRRLTEFKLMQKGIKKEDIFLAYEQLDFDDSEDAKLVAQKYLKNKQITKETLAKAYRYLVGKGFNYDQITLALSEFEEN